MPVYEYQCEKCGVRFDRLQAMSAAPVTECPECGGPVHRIISPVGVIFKGSGFYVTDNRKSNSTTSRNAKKSDDDASSGDTGSSSESKTSDSNASDVSSEKEKSKSTTSKSDSDLKK